MLVLGGTCGRQRVSSVGAWHKNSARRGSRGAAAAGRRCGGKGVRGAAGARTALRPMAESLDFRGAAS